MGKSILLLATRLTLGCGPLATRTNYNPEKNVAPIAGADKVNVAVTVRDLRSDKSTMGTMFAEFRTRPIASTNDVAEVVQRAFNAELESRGFPLGQGRALVTIDLNQLQTERVNKIFENSGTSLVALNVRVETSKATQRYSREIYGRSSGKNFSYSGAAQRLTEAALMSATWQVFADPTFIAALLSAGNSP